MREAKVQVDTPVVKYYRINLILRILNNENIKHTYF